MRALVIGLLLALPACAGLGGGASPDAWAISAEPLAEGVLVKWNVPAATGRTISLEVLDAVTQKRIPQPPLVAADLQARLLTDLPAGDWRIKVVVTDQGGSQRTFSTGPVTLDTSLVPVRPVGLADLGLASDLATPVLVALPSWHASDAASLAVRESLGFLALETARAAFGSAYFVDDDADVLLTRDVRKRLLGDRAVSDLPLDLDARALVVVDLRPGLGDDPATLTLRLLDITLRDYDWAPLPWNRYALVFEDFVSVEGLRYEAGVSHSRALLSGFRELYGALAADRHAQAYLAAVSGGREVFSEGQDRVADVVAWVGHLDDLTGSDGRRIDDNVRLIERSVLFMRDEEPEVDVLDPIEDATPGDEMGSPEVDDADPFSEIEDGSVLDLDDASASAEASGEGSRDDGR